MKRTTSKYSTGKVFFVNPVCFGGGGVLSCFVIEEPFLIFVVFLILSCVFGQHQCLYLSQKLQLRKTPIFGEVGGRNKRFSLRACVLLQTVTSYRCLAPFWGKFWLVFKKNCKIGI